MEAIRVDGFYRFIESKPESAISEGQRAFVNREHRYVLHAGFRPATDQESAADGSVDLNVIATNESLEGGGAELVVLTRRGPDWVQIHVESEQPADSDTANAMTLHVAENVVGQSDTAPPITHIRRLHRDPYISKRILIPSGARLDFAIALDRPVAELPDSTVQFQIFVRDAESAVEIFSETLESVDTPQWHDRSIDLTGYAGRIVQFEFRTSAESVDEMDSNGHLFTAPVWANPAIYAEPAQRIAQPPNVIIISLDTLRADHLGTYGYDLETSPNIDAFARNAVVFEQCIAPASWTTPSHASLMTGLSPTVHGAGGTRKWPLRDQIVTLAELARNRGYLTTAFTGGHAVSGRTGFAQGFDAYSDGERGNPNIQGAVERVVDQTLDWLDRYGKHPFFVFFHTFEIHSPYNPPNPYLDRFRITERTFVHGYALAVNREQAMENMGLYDGGIAYTDSILERLFQGIEDRGLLENTVVIIHSDHGEEFWDHGSYFHRHSLYEELVRVPLIIRLPGANPPAARIGRLVGLSDVFSTVLDLLQIQYVAPMDSFSLSPLLQGGSAADAYIRDAVLSVVYHQRGKVGRQFVSIRTQDLKYIVSAIAESDRATPSLGALVPQLGPNTDVVLSRAMLDLIGSAQPYDKLSEEFFIVRDDPKELENRIAQHSGDAAQLRERMRLLLEKFAADANAYQLDSLAVTPITAEQITELEAMGYL